VGGGSLLLARDAPIRRPADLAGKVVRVAGEPSTRLALILGATPVPMAEEEGASAVRRGTVQAALAFAPVGPAAQGMGAVTATLGARRMVVVAVNERIWRSLSPHQQEALKTAARHAEAASGRAAAEGPEYPCGIREAVCLSSAERALWRAAARPQIEDFLRRAAPLDGVLRAAAGPLD
jgi:C4-dicarboxylate-binding protein DctP